MNAVEKRVAARIKQETRELRADQMTVAKRRKVLETEATKLRGAAEAIFASLSEGVTLTASQTKTAFVEVPKLARIAREFDKLNAQAIENARRLEALDSEAEVARRLNGAKALGAGDEPVAGPEAARLVLLTKGKPMHVEEITREMLEAGVVKLTGKTPTQTVSAYLAKLAKRGDTFVRIAPGVFDLKDRPKGKTKTAEATSVAA
jgi:hypothetical protein